MHESFPYHRIAWKTSIFLMATLLLSLTAVPWYIYRFGLNAFLCYLFLFYFIATGLSITLGYHRLFSHLSFKAKFPVKLFVALFGAASFENSIIDWSSDHRRHHKHVDHDDDPYNIQRGFWHAHIGWLMFKLKPRSPKDNVADLSSDPLLVWQHKWCQWIAVTVGVIAPTLLGYYYGGPQLALGGFLIPGVARIVFVQHMTFLINSACHTLGKRPYSSRCSARDSAFMAFFTFGEGYHNFHHEFQHDYRNGVKPWQFDPTKWSIWLLSKLGLASNLRRVADEKILLAETMEAQRQLEQSLGLLDRAPQAASKVMEQSQEYLAKAMERMSTQAQELQKAIRSRIDISKESLTKYKEEVDLALKAARKVYTDNLQALSQSAATQAKS